MLKKKKTSDCDTENKENLRIPDTAQPHLEFNQAGHSNNNVQSCRLALSSHLAQARLQYSNKKEISPLIQSPIYVLEKCSKEGFKVIGCFFSAKKIAHLGTSYNMIIKLKNSGAIFKDRYKFF